MTSVHIDARSRLTAFAALEAEAFDVAVIGGGITGAGIARDAAMRGLRVALVEARDYASGTSSRSSKMIHGGLRYLAQGDVALVREAASERQILRRIAPNLTHLSPFLIPTVSVAMSAKLRAGLWTFEKLGGVPAEERHSVIGLEELRRREPLMRTDHLNGAVIYPEFLTDDARLVLANIRAAQAAGAVVLNYAAAVELTGDGLVAYSTVFGENLGARVRARLVINAAGPWVDKVRALEAGEEDSRLSLSRGIHLVLKRERLPVNATLILRARDKRSIFAVPRGDFTYLGTTDVFHGGADYWPEPSRADIDYLLRDTEAALDVAPISDEDVVSLWSGIRPLIAQSGKKANEVSRKDEIWTSPGGLLSIAGGKLSAYRAMAERVVDQVLGLLGQSALACATADKPLPDAGPTFTPIEDRDVPAEARAAVIEEGALFLEDYWVRRSGRAWFDHDAGLPSLVPAAAVMGDLLGWDDAEQSAQVARCRALHANSRKLLGERHDRA